MATKPTVQDMLKAGVLTMADVNFYKKEGKYSDEAKAKAKAYTENPKSVISKQQYVGPDIAEKIGLTEADQKEFKTTGSYSTRSQALIDKYKAGGRVPLVKTPAEDFGIKNKTFQIDPEEEKRIQETQKAYYDPYFNQKRNELLQDYNSNKQDIDRLAQYAKTDYATKLGETNKTFARNLNKATNTYGQRGILGSGIQKSDVREATGDFTEGVNNLGEQARRTAESYAKQGENLGIMYNRNTDLINQNQQAQTYQDTMTEISNRANEFYRQLGQEEIKPRAYNIQIQKPTSPIAPYTPSKVVNKTIY